MVGFSFSLFPYADSFTIESPVLSPIMITKIRSPEKIRAMSIIKPVKIPEPDCAQNISSLNLYRRQYGVKINCVQIGSSSPVSADKLRFFDKVFIYLRFQFRLSAPLRQIKNAIKRIQLKEISVRLSRRRAWPAVSGAVEIRSSLNTSRRSAFLFYKGRHGAYIPDKPVRKSDPASGIRVVHYQSQALGRLRNVLDMKFGIYIPAVAGEFLGYFFSVIERWARDYHGFGIYWRLNFFAHYRRQNQNGEYGKYSDYYTRLFHVQSIKL
mgnify:CR=1 FL=1